MRQPIELIQQESTSQCRLLKCAGCLQPPLPPKSASVQRYTQTLGAKLAGEQRRQGGMKINREPDTRMHQSSDVPNTKQLTTKSKKRLLIGKSNIFATPRRTECGRSSYLLQPLQDICELFTVLKQKNTKPIGIVAMRSQKEKYLNALQKLLKTHTS